MGEARYSLTAKFASAEELEAKKDAILAFFDEGAEAENFWQNCRGLARLESPESPDKFWPAFTEKFPNVSMMIADLVGGDCNNALAGELDFPPIDDRTFETDGNLLYVDGTVWHLCSWNRLCKFLKQHFGAKSATWESDEYD